MVEAGRPGDLRGGDGRRPSPRATPSSSRSWRSRSSCAPRVGKPKRPVAKKELDPAHRGRDRGRARRRRSCDAMRDQGQARDVRPDEEGARTSTSPPSPRTSPRRRRRSPPSTTGCARSCSSARSSSNGHRLDGRRFDEIRPITCEVGVLPAHPRLGALHPRRDPGPGHRHPRHLRGRADHRHRAGGRVPQALHAALQLPALLGRRGEVPARPRPPRDRPRRPRRARAARDAARPRRASPTRSASSRTSSSRTARPRWPPSAAAPSPSWTPACPSRARWPASPWAS